jgi:hypothetical protein
MIQTKEELTELNRVAHWESFVEQQEADISLMTGHFEYSAFDHMSFEERETYEAQLQISTAKQKIRDLQKEIDRQVIIIEDAEQRIDDFKKQIKEKNVANSRSGRGRPERSADKENIAKKFITKWVQSLMIELEVSSCTKLEEMICATTIISNNHNKNGRKFPDQIISSKCTERNWRRWKNGDAIPTYSTLSIIFSTKIESGKYAGKLLLDIPTTPEANALLTLFRFM